MLLMKTIGTIVYAQMSNVFNLDVAQLNVLMISKQIDIVMSGVLARVVII